MTQRSKINLSVFTNYTRRFELSLTKSIDFYLYPFEKRYTVNCKCTRDFSEENLVPIYMHCLFKH